MTIIQESERLRYTAKNGIPLRTYKKSFKRFLMEAVTVSLIFIFIAWIVITR